MQEQTIFRGEAFLFPKDRIMRKQILRNYLNDIFSDSPNNTSTIAMDGDITLKETSSNTSFDLDLLPTWRLKECIYQRLPLIKASINRSKAELVRPLCAKVATDNNLCRIIVPYLTSFHIQVVAMQQKNTLRTITSQTGISLPIVKIIQQKLLF